MHVNEKVWLWCHQAGAHNGKYNLPGDSSISPQEAAVNMGIDNVLMVCLADEPKPPFAPHAAPLNGLRQVVWSIVGDAGSTRNDIESDLQPVIDLAQTQANVVGGIMDDFFHNDDSSGGDARHDLDAVRDFRQQLNAAGLELWTVLYTHQLREELVPYLNSCDQITYWTWRATDLPDLDKNLAALESLAPNASIVLGCYMWDYGDAKPMPLASMQTQCEQGRRWLEEGRISGLIFLCGGLCDLNIEAVNWTRSWLHNWRVSQ